MSRKSLNSIATSAVALMAAVAASAAFADAAPAPGGGVMGEKKSDAAVIHESGEILGNTPAFTPPAPPDVVRDEMNHDPSPDEIRKIKALWEQMRRAQETQAGTQPRPSISIENLNLSPGSTPPVVRLSSHTGAVLDFIDANGTPWPVDHVSNLSANEVDVQTEDQGGSSKSDKKSDQPEVRYDTNAISAKARHFDSIGNAAVFLKTLPTPIIITFLSGQKDVDYRVDFRVPAYYNKDSVGAFEKNYFDNRLAAATMGLTPNGCHRLQSDSEQVMAWGCDDKNMALRVDGVLMSPAPIDGEKVDSIDGTKAYMIPSAPVLTVSVGGKISFVKIEIKD